MQGEEGGGMIEVRDKGQRMEGGRSVSCFRKFCFGWVGGAGGGGL